MLSMKHRMHDEKLSTDTIVFSFYSRGSLNSSQKPPDSSEVQAASIKRAQAMENAQKMYVFPSTVFTD